MGPAPITDAGIVAYCTLTGRRFDRAELELIERLDDVRLESYAEHQEKRSKAPKPGNNKH